MASIVAGRKQNKQLLLYCFSLCNPGLFMAARIISSSCDHTDEQNAIFAKVIKSCSFPRPMSAFHFTEDLQQYFVSYDTACYLYCRINHSTLTLNFISTIHRNLEFNIPFETHLYHPGTGIPGCTGQVYPLAQILSYPWNSSSRNCHSILPAENV